MIVKGAAGIWRTSVSCVWCWWSGGVSRIMEDKCKLCVVLVVWRGQQEYGGQV